VSLLVDAYFVFGALIEERRNIRRFGEEYRRYMKEVPLLMPSPGSLLRALKGGFGKKAG
jgi:protein-S-isoprenylcysteine O-methyltransferase Ste14